MPPLSPQEPAPNVQLTWTPIQPVEYIASLRKPKKIAVGPRVPNARTDSISSISSTNNPHPFC